MRESEALSTQVLTRWPAPDERAVDEALARELAASTRKVVVLDDDPTGVQTVHDVPVFTNWEPETIREAFDDPGRMFFVLTNSRGMTATQTEREHIRTARAIHDAAAAAGRDYILISRSDSTLRGH